MPSPIIDFPGAATLPVVRPQATVKRVAELLAYSDRHIRDLCARGELETNGERGRGYRIYLDSVAAYQERRRQLAQGSR